MINAISAKLYNNIFSPRVCGVLGLRQYAQLLMTFVLRLPDILKSGDLRPLDSALAGQINHFTYRGVRFSLDLKYCDKHVRDGSFAFGGAREIYIRDCYFKFQHPAVYQSVRTVVDIGANRGVFSTLMATVAEFVLCVEAQPHFVPVIQRNMAVNKFRNYAIECALVGSGGAIGGDGAGSLTMDRLFQLHGLEQVDLVKMDIEGSEFSLFEAEGWLDRVDAISMEVHRAHGNPSVVVQKLESKGFAVVLADENLKLLNDATLADFIFASKQSRSSSRQ